jgi:hypothetical protein
VSQGTVKAVKAVKAVKTIKAARALPTQTPANARRSTGPGDGYGTPYHMGCTVNGSIALPGTTLVAGSTVTGCRGRIRVGLSVA